MLENEEGFFDALLTITTVRADETGPTRKKYHYRFFKWDSPHGYSRREALDALLKQAKDEGWRVWQPMN